MKLAPQATLVITTRNRKEDLRRALASASRQTAAVEIIVLDDASTDGTPETVRREFPEVQVHESREPLGYIVQRNRGAKLATAPLIFSIDDDAAFASPDTIAQTLGEFDHSRVGAVAIPFIDVKISDQVQSRAPDAGGIYVSAYYIGTAHAVRKDVFLRLGGYRQTLFHFGEERDFCARMLDAGYVTRLGTADPIHHFFSPKRQQSRSFIQRGRNQILYPWHNAPMPYMPLHVAAATLNMMRFGLRERHPIWAAWGIMRGFGACGHELFQRRPLTRRTYLLLQELLRHVRPLSEIEGRLTAPAFADLPALPFETLPAEQ